MNNNIFLQLQVYALNELLLGTIHADMDMSRPKLQLKH